MKEKVKLFNGVEQWFERIKEYGKQHGVLVEHYIIFSGLKEMIEGTFIAQKGVFEKIYASSFYYNESGIAQWSAQVIYYTSKTQCLFRIEKGVLDINDPGANDYFTLDEMRVPFRNMVYDPLKLYSLTDWLVEMYVKSLECKCYFCDKSYDIKCPMNDLGTLRKLFNISFIQANRPIDDNEMDHTHGLHRTLVSGTIKFLL